MGVKEPLLPADRSSRVEVMDVLVLDRYNWWFVIGVLPALCAAVFLFLVVTGHVEFVGDVRWAELLGFRLYDNHPCITAHNCYHIGGILIKPTNPIATLQSDFNTISNTN